MHHRRQPLGDLGPEGAQRLGLGGEELEEDLRELAGFSGVRRSPGQELVEHGAHGVEIGAVIGLMSR
jgi:hypothetical protein